MSNLLEYALAGDPNVNTQSNLPGQSVAGNALQLAFTRRSASEAAYAVQASDDLAAWTDVAVLPSGGSAWFGAATVTETGGGSTRAVVVRDAESLSNHRQRFLRLRVSVP